MANNRVALTRKAAVALGALTVYLRPKLAADAKLDLESVLQDVTSARSLSLHQAFFFKVRQLSVNRDKWHFFIRDVKDVGSDPLRIDFV